MGIGIQRRRGTTVEHNSFTGKNGEITVDTTKKVVVVHDGSTLGGVPMAREDHSHSQATTGSDGFMTAADKTKLDGLPSSIVYQQIQLDNANQTVRNVLNFSPQFAIVDDGGGNKTTVHISDKSITPGAYTKITLNTYGVATSASQLAAGDIPNITAAKVTDFDTQVRTSRLDQMAAPSATVNFGSQVLSNVADPVNPTDAANKQYVDATRTGLTFKESVRVASTTNINISLPGATIDGVTLDADDRVLLKDQSTLSQNGIYRFVASNAPMVRTTDADTSAEMVPGTFVLVTEGNVNGDTAWVLATDDPIVLDTTNLDFVQFSGAATVSAGDGLEKIGSVLNVVPANTGRLTVGPSGVDLALSGVVAGSYNTVTVDGYGRVTSASNTAYQASNDLLGAISGLAVNGFAVRTSASTAAARSITAGTGIAVTNGSGASGNPEIAVVEDTTIQKIRVSNGGSLAGTRREINFVAGANIEVTAVEDGPTNRVNVTIGTVNVVSSTASFLTLAADPSLTNERVLTAGTGINLNDGGAGNALTVNMQTDWGTIV